LVKKPGFRDQEAGDKKKEKSKRRDDRDVRQKQKENALIVERSDMWLEVVKCQENVLIVQSQDILTEIVFNQKR